MKTLTKILKMTVIGAVIAGLLTACTPTIPVAQHESLIKDMQANNTIQVAILQEQIQNLSATSQEDATKLAELQTQLDSLQQASIDQEARDAQVIEDYKVELAKYAVPVEAEITIDDWSQDDISLGAVNINFTLDNSDLKFLQDDQIEFDDDFYDYEETIVVNDLAILTSLKSDENFKDLPALGFMSEDSVQYLFSFTDDLNYTLVTPDVPLILPLLMGKKHIVDVSSSKFTYLDGDEYDVVSGDIVKLGDKEVKFGTIGDGKLSVFVDDKMKLVDEDESADFDGVSVYVYEILYTAKESQANMANVWVSTDDAKQVIKNGDDFDEDGKFEWTITTNGDLLKSIGVSLADKSNDLDEETLLPGEIMSFSGLFKMSFDFTNEPEYKAFEVSFDDIDVGNATINTVKFDAKDGDDLILGSEELSTAWFDGTSVYYKDDDNDWVISNSTMTLENDDVSYAVSMSGTNLTIGSLLMDVQGNRTRFGALVEDAENTDLIVGGLGIGSKDTDVLLEDGALVIAPSDDLDNDELSFKLPSKVVETVIKFFK